MKFRLQFQRPPFTHWVLSVRVEDRAHVVTAKIFFQDWRSSEKVPRPRFVVPDAIRLAAAAKASLEAMSR